MEITNLILKNSQYELKLIKEYSEKELYYSERKAEATISYFENMKDEEVENFIKDKSYTFMICLLLSMKPYKAINLSYTDIFELIPIEYQDDLKEFRKQYNFEEIYDTLRDKEIAFEIYDKNYITLLNKNINIEDFDLYDLHDCGELLVTDYMNALAERCFKFYKNYGVNRIMELSFYYLKGNKK